MEIQEVLTGLRVDFLESGHHHNRPGWIQLQGCPFCGSQNYHLGYSLAAHFFSCWSCGGHNSYDTLVSLGATPKLALTFIQASRESEFVFEKRVRGGLKEPKSRQRLLAAHKRYLKERGIVPKEVERVWQVQGIGIHSRLSWRLYIPITYRGQVVSWTTRAIGDRVEQRYLSASAEEEAINHKELVYGMDYCRHSIVIVEGPVDAWKIGPGAGALFGTAYTPAQLLKLTSIPNRFICFDSDPKAQEKAKELAENLSCFDGETTNLILDAKDPGAASRKEIQQIRRAAKLG